MTSPQQSTDEQQVNPLALQDIGETLLPGAATPEHPYLSPTSVSVGQSQQQQPSQQYYGSGNVGGPLLSSAPFLTPESSDLSASGGNSSFSTTTRQRQQQPRSSSYFNNTAAPTTTTTTTTTNAQTENSSGGGGSGGGVETTDGSSGVFPSGMLLTSGVLNGSGHGLGSGGGDDASSATNAVLAPGPDGLVHIDPLDERNYVKTRRFIDTFTWIDEVPSFDCRERHCASVSLASHDWYHLKTQEGQCGQGGISAAVTVSSVGGGGTTTDATLSRSERNSEIGTSSATEDEATIIQQMRRSTSPLDIRGGGGGGEGATTPEQITTSTLRPGSTASLSSAAAAAATAAFINNSNNNSNAAAAAAAAEPSKPRVKNILGISQTCNMMYDVTLIQAPLSVPYLRYIVLDAILLMKVQHDNVKKCHGFFYDRSKQQIEIYFEHTSSNPLLNLVSHITHTDMQIEDYILQIVGGLAALQEKGLCHLNVKPSSVIVNKDGCVKLTDFFHRSKLSGVIQEIHQNQQEQQASSSSRGGGGGAGGGREDIIPSAKMAVSSSLGSERGGGRGERAHHHQSLPITASMANIPVVLSGRDHDGEEELQYHQHHHYYQFSPTSAAETSAAPPAAVPSGASSSQQLQQRLRDSQHPHDRFVVAESTEDITGKMTAATTVDGSSSHSHIPPHQHHHHQHQHQRLSGSSSSSGGGGGVHLSGSHNSGSRSRTSWEERNSVVGDETTAPPSPTTAIRDNNFSAPRQPTSAQQQQQPAVHRPQQHQRHQPSTSSSSGSSCVRVQPLRYHTVPDTTSTSVENTWGIRGDLVCLGILCCDLLRRQPRSTLPGFEDEDFSVRNFLATLDVAQLESVFIALSTEPNIFNAEISNLIAELLRWEPDLVQLTVAEVAEVLMELQSVREAEKEEAQRAKVKRLLEEKQQQQQQTTGTTAAAGRGGEGTGRSNTNNESTTAPPPPSDTLNQTAAYLGTGGGTSSKDGDNNSSMRDDSALTPIGGGSLFNGGDSGTIPTDIAGQLTRQPSVMTAVGVGGGSGASGMGSSSLHSPSASPHHHSSSALRDGNASFSDLFDEPPPMNLQQQQQQQQQKQQQQQRQKSNIINNDEQSRPLVHVVSTPASSVLSQGGGGIGAGIGAGSGGGGGGGAGYSFASSIMEMSQTNTTIQGTITISGLEDIGTLVCDLSENESGPCHHAPYASIDHVSKMFRQSKMFAALMPVLSNSDSQDDSSMTLQGAGGGGGGGGASASASGGVGATRDESISTAAPEEGDHNIADAAAGGSRAGMYRAFAGSSSIKSVTSSAQPSPRKVTTTTTTQQQQQQTLTNTTTTSGADGSSTTASHGTGDDDDDDEGGTPGSRSLSQRSSISGGVSPRQGKFFSRDPSSMGSSTPSPRRGFFYPTSPNDARTLGSTSRLSCDGGPGGLRRGGFFNHSFDALGAASTGSTRQQQQQNNSQSSSQRKSIVGGGGGGGGVARRKSFHHFLHHRIAHHTSPFTHLNVTGASNPHISSTLHVGNLGNFQARQNIEILHAVCEDTNSQHIIKKINTSQNTQSVLERAKLEVRLLCQAHHPQIVKCYGSIYKEQHKVFVFMLEYCSGANLQQVREQIPELTEAQVACITKGLLDALVYLHYHCLPASEGGIAHFDIKPANVMLLPEGGVKLIDFGEARVLRDGNRATSLSHLRPTGTTHFMPPEMFDLKYSFKADVWAVGCMVMYLVTGRLPFGELQGYALQNHISNLQPGDTSFLPTETDQQLISKKISSSCVDFIKQCLTVDVRRRPTSEEMQNHPWVANETRCVVSTTALTMGGGSTAGAASGGVGGTVGYDPRYSPFSSQFVGSGGDGGGGSGASPFYHQQRNIHSARASHPSAEKTADILAVGKNSGSGNFVISDSAAASVNSAVKGASGDAVSGTVANRAAGGGDGNNAEQEVEGGEKRRNVTPSNGDAVDAVPKTSKVDGACCAWF